MAKKQIQSPLTVDEQIKNLKALNLVINDEIYAKKFLNSVSYYRFVKAYSLGLKEHDGSFKAGITFEQLVQLYEFDSDFRHLIFKQIEDIEVEFRCRVSNWFSLKYGSLGYLDEKNFENYPKEFKKDLLSEINRNSKSSFVKNF